MSEASDRASEAWEQRFKHAKAANEWLAISVESPDRREICEILSAWMSAYATADADAEQELRALAAKSVTP